MLTFHPHFHVVMMTSPPLHGCYRFCQLRQPVLCTERHCRHERLLRGLQETQSSVEETTGTSKSFLDHPRCLPRSDPHFFLSLFLFPLPSSFHTLPPSLPPSLSVCLSPSLSLSLSSPSFIIHSTCSFLHVHTHTHTHTFHHTYTLPPSLSPTLTHTHTHHVFSHTHSIRYTIFWQSSFVLWICTL